MNDASTAVEAWPEAPFHFDTGGPLTTAELSKFLDLENAANYDIGNPEYYLPKWTEVLNGSSKFAGFNWAAAICGWLWCLYRKQYKLAIVIFLLEALAFPILIGAAIAIAVGEAVFQPQFETLIAYGGLLVVRPWLGFFANRRYLQRAVEIIATARQSGRENLEQIRKRGGTSTIALIVGFIVNAGFTLSALILETATGL